jgi:hypothetical protein
MDRCLAISPAFSQSALFYLREKRSVFVLTQIVNATRLLHQLPWYFELFSIRGSVKLPAQNPRQMKVFFIAHECSGWSTCTSVSAKGQATGQI